MTPIQALRVLETVLNTLDSLLPDFRGTLDHADLTEARAAIQDVHARLAREIAENEGLLRDTP